MKTIALLGACVIAGAVRYPSEGHQTVDDDEARRLIEAGLAEEADAEEVDDGLDEHTVAELRKPADEDGVDLGHAKAKPDIIAAIRAHRA